jgi:hypothetical protein
MTKPTSIPELESWVDQHENDGTINGVPVFPEGRSEIRYGFIPGDLYDLALTRAAPFSWNKSEIATHGAALLLSNAIIETAALKLVTPLNCEDGTGTEFRAYLPTGTYNLVQEAKSNLGWTNSQTMALIVAYFAYSPGIEKIYQKWAKDFADDHCLTIAQVEELIYQRRLLQARKQRLKMSKQQGRFIDDRKVAT